MPERPRRLDPTARVCVWWAVGCYLAGALAYAGVNRVLLSGQPDQLLLEIAQPLLLLLQWGFFGIGAALVGAAVVIQWLRTQLVSKVRQAPPER